MKEIDKGQHFDTGKLEWSLMPWTCLKEVVKVFAYGAYYKKPKSYGRHNYQKGVSVTALLNSIERHKVAFFYECQDNDDESGLSHLAHLICDAIMALYMVMFKPEFDDRKKYRDGG